MKTVGLLGMLGEQVGLRASEETVAVCLGDQRATRRALERLKQHSLLVYRQFRDAFQIWEGSDLDLDDLVLRAQKQLPPSASVVAVLQRHAPRTPLVARRHLFKTGTLRFFDVHFVDASSLLRDDELNLTGDGDGHVLLALPATDREADDLKTQQSIGGLTIERNGSGKPVVLVVPEASERLSQLARELAAAQLVRSSTAELQSDPAARTELTGRIEELERQMAAEVDRAFDPRRSAWFTAGERRQVASWRAASEALSVLCDECYSGAPAIRNELLNRRSLSTSAARARRNLIEAMILHGDISQLGFEGNPPEVSMYRSLLKEHGFHRRRNGKWGFGTRRGMLQPLWKEIDRFLHDTEASRQPLTELYAQLRRPPFGLKDGPLPIIVVAALLARNDDVAIYERGSFVPALTPSHAERLLRSPDGFEIRQSRVGGSRRYVIERLASLAHLAGNGEASLLRVVRGLVRFVTSLTPYAAARCGSPSRLVTPGRRCFGLGSPPSWCSKTSRSRAGVARSGLTAPRIGRKSTSSSTPSTRACARSGTPIRRSWRGRARHWRDT